MSSEWLFGDEDRRESEDAKMGKDRDALRRLAALCKQWGGSLRVLPRERYQSIGDLALHDKEGWCDAPFVNGHAINWKHKEIVAEARQVSVNAVIHEMGHVFASAVHPNDDDATEWEWLGWEIALARTVRCYRQWDRDNGNYQIEGTGPTTTWGELSMTEKRPIIAERLDFAQALGIVDDDLRPMAIR